VACGQVYPGAGEADQEHLIKNTLSTARHVAVMVIRSRLRAVLTALGLYTGAALLIGYFGINAYTGAHGLKAKKDLVVQMRELSDELSGLQREHALWVHRLSLLRADRLDPDMLDERARAMLDYADPNDLVLMLPPK
jgi:cell division protein FtsB